MWKLCVFLGFLTSLVLWFTFLPLVTNLLHYNEAVNRGSSPQFTSSHPNTSWHLLPWLTTGMLISCNTLQRLFNVSIVWLSSHRHSTASVRALIVSSVQHLVCGVAEASWVERRLSLCPCPASSWGLSAAGVDCSLQMNPLEGGVRSGVGGREEKLPG